MSIVLLLTSIIFSYLLTVFLLKFSKNFGVKSREKNNQIRWGTSSKPTIGGISFYLTFILGALLLAFWMPSAINPENNKQFIALFLSATLAFLIGLADDAYNTKPYMKLVGQIICGLILIAFGIHIRYFEIPLLDWGLTIFWVIAMMNSLNMLDNMDAVTTTVSLSIIAVTLGMIVLNGMNPSMYYILIIIAGSFIGFLFLNWKPSKAYMGDTGSMFVGLVLAFMGIIFFWNIKTDPDNIDFVRKGLIPFILFIVPIMDTSFVTVARLYRRVSPMQGGRDHTTHHLAHLGVPENLIPVTLGSLSIFSGCVSLYANHLISNWIPLYTILFTLYPVSVFSVFIYLYRKGMKIGKLKELKAIRKNKAQQIKDKIMQDTAKLHLPKHKRDH